MSIDSRSVRSPHPFSPGPQPSPGFPVKALSFVAVGVVLLAGVGLACWLLVRSPEAAGLNARTSTLTLRRGPDAHRDVLIGHSSGPL